MNDETMTPDCPEEGPTSTRNDLQLGRRFFHMSMGTIVVTTYALFLSHQETVYILGTGACLLYLMEQIRINYPELASKLMVVSKYLLRAEEQLHESAAIPYAIAILLTLISFPKVVAMIAILTLAWADPLSALIGIKYGKHKIAPGKSMEGSGAFFIASFLCSLLTLGFWNGHLNASIWLFSLAQAIIVTLFELLPLRIDDNLTIPLFTATVVWILGSLSGIAI
jgi:dolichol kinase